MSFFKRACQKKKRLRPDTTSKHGLGLPILTKYSQILINIALLSIIIYQVFPIRSFITTFQIKFRLFIISAIFPRIFYFHYGISNGIFGLRRARGPWTSPLGRAGLKKGQHLSKGLGPSKGQQGIAIYIYIYILICIQVGIPYWYSLLVFPIGIPYWYSPMVKLLYMGCQ